MQGDTEDKEGQQTTACLLLQLSAVGWLWKQSPGQASKLSISRPQQSSQGKSLLGYGSQEASSAALSILDPDRAGWMKKWQWMSVMVQLWLVLTDGTRRHPLFV